MLKHFAAKETKSSVVLSWLIKQLDGEYRYIVADFILITSMLLIILHANNSTCFIMTRHNKIECKKFTLCNVSIILSWFLRSKNIGLVRGSSCQHLNIMSCQCFIYHRLVLGMVH